MKKLLAIMVLGLLFSTTSYSGSNSLNQPPGISFFLIIIITFIIFVSFMKREKPKRYKPTKNKAVKKASKVYYTNQYGWSFPTKYVLLAIPGVGGLIYFENGFTKLFFGFYLLGCFIGFIKSDK